MVSFKLLITSTVMALAAASPFKPKDTCGKINVLFTGLPPSHPLVTAQGFDPALVDRVLRADAAAIIKAGYNLRVSFLGPEQPIDVLEDELKGTKWSGTGVGFGVRGSPMPELTVRFEDIIQLYRDEVPRSRILFNHSPDTALWAIQREFPLSSNCTNSPGKDLGFNIICDIC